jgi:hypothetical protein
MKLTKEDIQKYGTEGEKKLLESKYKTVAEKLPPIKTNEDECPVCGTNEIENIGGLEYQGDFSSNSLKGATVIFKCTNGHTFYKLYNLQYLQSEEE